MNEIDTKKKTVNADDQSNMTAKMNSVVATPINVIATSQNPSRKIIDENQNKIIFDIPAGDDRLIDIQFDKETEKINPLPNHFEVSFEGARYYNSRGFFPSDKEVSVDVPIVESKERKRYVRLPIDQIDHIVDLATEDARRVYREYNIVTSHVYMKDGSILEIDKKIGDFDGSPIHVVRQVPTTREVSEKTWFQNPTDPFTGKWYQFFVVNSDDVVGIFTNYCGAMGVQDLQTGLPIRNILYRPNIRSYRFGRREDTIRSILVLKNGRFFLLPSSEQFSMLQNDLYVESFPVPKPITSQDSATGIDIPVSIWK